MKLKVGDSASYSRTINEQDIEDYAKISGDFNPVHLDDGYARNTPFNERIAHGMLGAGFISAVLAMKLPGEGTIYLGQTLKFENPAHIGDTLTATATVIKILNEAKGIYELETVVRNQNNDIVISGIATVKYDDNNVSIGKER